MNEKINSKPHLLNTLFDFCAVSCEFGLKVYKSANMTQKIFFPNIFNMDIKKTQNLMLISNPLKK
jgi:hypothetical protein